MSVPKITIYTVAYNEELMLQLMIHHYRARFHNCHIVIYDNQSTDNTVTIAKANCCEIRHYDSGGKVDDQLLVDTKENCWKDAKTDWVLVCDVDELLDITEKELKYEESLGTTKIKSECWHMVNMKNNLDVNSIHYGFRDPNDVWKATLYDKDLLWNKKLIQKIGYEGAGCHVAHSQGKIVNSSKKYRLLHYKYVNPDLFVGKQKISAQRLSDINKKNGWGIQCLRDESLLREEFDKVRNGAIKLFEENKFVPHFYYNIQGWFDFGNLYYYVINSLPNDSHIVEVGAWKGKSSAFLAVEAINSGKNIQVDVVDLWTGEEDNPEAFTTDEEFMAYNKNIYELFRKNLAQVIDKITPVQMSSTKASFLYADNSLDFVFIDANHDYENVKKDIDHWLPKIKSGGYMGGHDFNHVSFPGVIQAVKETFPSFELFGVSWLAKV